jgi:hypothetical protein
MQQPTHPAAMNTIRFLATMCCLLIFGHLAGCDRPEPKPDGSSGIRGICLLPAEPPGEDGKIPERRPWAGIQVHANRINSAHDDTEQTKPRVMTDANGAYQIALNPGQYLVGVHDPHRLQNKMTSPQNVKVEAGRFTEVTIDYDKINVQDLPKRR